LFNFFAKITKKVYFRDIINKKIILLKYLNYLFLAFCLLLSINLFAQPCPPISLRIEIHYDRGLQELPDGDELCITVIWEFDDGTLCPQIYKGAPNPQYETPTGTISAPTILPVGNPCPPAPPCMTKENVVSITVIVTDCKVPPDFYVIKKVYGYQEKIEIDYWE